MTLRPVDESLCSEDAAERIAGLRAEEQRAAEAAGATYRERSALQQRASDLRARICRYDAHCAQAPTSDGAEDTAHFEVHTPLGAFHFSEVPARIPALRAELAGLQQEIAALEERHAATLAHRTALAKEANLLEAREKERFRCDALVSPTGSMLPPRIVR